MRNDDARESRSQSSPAETACSRGRAGHGATSEDGAVIELPSPEEEGGAWLEFLEEEGAEYFEVGA